MKNNLIDKELKDYDLTTLKITKVKSPKVIGFEHFYSYKAKDEKISLKYRFYLPVCYKQKGESPLFIWFHGADEKGDDNLLQLLAYKEGLQEWLNKEELVNSFILAPQCPLFDKWVNSSRAREEKYVQYNSELIGESNSLSLVLKIIKYLNLHYSIDASRIYIMGFSLGAFACWDLLVRHPNLISGAIPIAGGCDTKKANKLITKPIYIFHAINDQYVNVIASENMYQILQKLGNNKVKFVKYKWGKHYIWQKVLKQKNLHKWLYKQINDIMAIGDDNGNK